MRAPQSQRSAGACCSTKSRCSPASRLGSRYRGDSAILGLPGNPTSALVCARLFLRPLIERMLGRDPLKACETRAARLRTPLQANGPRETYLRAITELDHTGQLWVSGFENQELVSGHRFRRRQCPSSFALLINPRALARTSSQTLPI